MKTFETARDYDLGFVAGECTGRFNWNIFRRSRYAWGAAMSACVHGSERAYWWAHSRSGPPFIYATGTEYGDDAFLRAALTAKTRAAQMGLSP